VVLGLLGMVGTVVMAVSVQTARVLAGSAERGADTQDVRVALEAVTRSLRGALDPDGVAPDGSVCTPSGTGGTQCAFLDSSSAYPELRSGPSRIAFWSSLYDLPSVSPPPDDTTNPCAATTRTRADGHVEPRLFQYELTPTGELVERMWTRTQYDNGCIGAVEPRTRVLTRDLDPGAGTPVFTYLSAEDTRKSYDTATEDRALPASGPLDSTVTDPTGATDSPLLTATDVGRLAAVEVHLAAARATSGRVVAAVDSVVLPNDPEKTPR
jgi:hypothetical protein